MNTNKLIFGNKYSFLLDNEENSSYNHDCGCGGGAKSNFSEPPILVERGNTRLFCVTTSCCSFGIFTVDLWSQTTCHSVSVNSVSMLLSPATDEREVEVINDVLLARIRGRNGESLVLAKGKYSVKNNQITFTPKSVARRKEYCYNVDAEGSILGHQYSYHIKYCISFLSRFSTLGTVELSPNLSIEQLTQIYVSKNHVITFDKDIHVRGDNGLVDFYIKSGDYHVNEDGKIYLQNVKLR
jgi:hypothetical protein